MVEHLQREAQPVVLDVIHEDVAHADPGMPGEARGEQQRRDAHPALREEVAPDAVVIGWPPRSSDEQR